MSVISYQLRANKVTALYFGKKFWMGEDICIYLKNTIFHFYECRPNCKDSLLKQQVKKIKFWKFGSIHFTSTFSDKQHLLWLKLAVACYVLYHSGYSFHFRVSFLLITPINVSGHYSRVLNAHITWKTVLFYVHCPGSVYGHYFVHPPVHPSMCVSV